MKTKVAAPKLNAVFPTRRILSQLATDARFRTLTGKTECRVISQTDMPTMTVIHNGKEETLLPKALPVFELKSY